MATLKSFLSYTKFILSRMAIDNSIRAPDSGIADEPAYKRHPKLWLDDGSLILRSGNNAFKVHRTLLQRHSQVLSTWSSTELTSEGHPVYDIPDALGVRYGDVEALLSHLYHDEPLTSKSQFSRVASVLRASSSRGLDFPSIHQLARDHIISMFPSGPQPFFHPDCLEEALAVATEYQIHTIQKGLFYSLVTTSNFDIQEDGTLRIDNPVQDSAPPIESKESSSSSPSDGLSVSPPASQTQHGESPVVLSAADAQRCMGLMTRIIDHFTPILFTPATTPHMACTDVFANTWMPLVIQPALENDGVYKPLETLQRIMDVDWAAQGLCPACVREKREEWKGEQEDVWNRMDAWLGIEACENTTT